MVKLREHVSQSVSMSAFTRALPVAELGLSP